MIVDVLLKITPKFTIIQSQKMKKYAFIFQIFQTIGQLCLMACSCAIITEPAITVFFSSIILFLFA